MLAQKIYIIYIIYNIYNIILVVCDFYNMIAIRSLQNCILYSVSKASAEGNELNQKIEAIIKELGA